MQIRRTRTKRQISLVGSKWLFDLVSDPFYAHKGKCHYSHNGYHRPTQVAGERERESENIESNTLLQVNTIFVRRSVIVYAYSIDEDLQDLGIGVLAMRSIAVM